MFGSSWLTSGTELISRTRGNTITMLWLCLFAAAAHPLAALTLQHRHTRPSVDAAHRVFEAELAATMEFLHNTRARVPSNDTAAAPPQATKWFLGAPGESCSTATPGHPSTP